MNHGTKSPNGKKPGRYQSFYMKKLQTQTSVSSSLERGLEQTSGIIEREIERIQKGLQKRKETFTKAMRKKGRIEEENERSRTDLKSRIEEKMRRSHNNVLEYRQKSSSSLSTRLKAEREKVQEIRRLEKTIYQEKYERSRQLSSSTEKFFLELDQRKKKRSQGLSIDTSYLLTNRKKQPLFSPVINKHFKPRESSHEKSHQYLIENPESRERRLKLSMLRTSPESILERQRKKGEMQRLKENSFLRDYVQKLECIEASRKKAKLEAKVPQSTIAKLVNRQIGEEEIESRKKFSRSSVKQAVGGKSSFSELYRTKIQQKKQKKGFFLSQSIAQGDLIVRDGVKRTSEFRLNKLIRDTQNQLARRQNFRYMEKFLTRNV